MKKFVMMKEMDGEQKNSRQEKMEEPSVAIWAGGKKWRD